MSAAFLSDACHAAQGRAATARGQQLMYGALGFATAYSACCSLFAGLWLCRWWRLRRSNPELLSCVWRYTGLFLSMSFAACIFGATAGVFRLRNIPSKSEFALIFSTGNATTCQRYLSLSVASARNMSSYRFAYSFECACLFLTVALGLDRINEALSSKGLTAEELSDSSFEGDTSTQSRLQRGRATRMQQQPLLPLAAKSTSPPDLLPRTPRILFKSGLVLVALFFCAALVAVVTAASIQGRSVSIMENALQLCSVDGSSNEEVDAALAPGNNLKAPLSATILAGYVAELSAAVAVILLYIAIGILSASVVGAARRYAVLYCHNFSHFLTLRITGPQEAEILPRKPRAASG
jgi:hypothetical protein